MDEIRIDINLEDNGSAKTVQELRDYVEQLRGTLGNTTKTIIEEKDHLRELTEELKQLQKASVESETFTKAQRERMEELTTAVDKQKNVISELEQLYKAQVKQSNAAAGSYDELNQMLGQLRDGYRQMSAEERKGAVGQETLVRIKQLDKELKGIDAEMGNFQRNVGNYAEAFKGMTIVSQGAYNGFHAAAGALNLLGLQGSETADFMNKAAAAMMVLVQVSQSIPAIASAFKAATVAAKAFIGGLNGVKAALISTGIGAIVVALGAVIAYWDDIASLWKDTSAEDEAKAAIDDLNKALQEHNDTLQATTTDALNKYSEALRNAGDDAQKAAQAEKEYNEAIRQANKTKADADLLDAQRAAQRAKSAQTEAKNDEARKVATEELEKAEKAVLEAEKAQAQAINAIEKAESSARIAERKAIEDAAKARSEATKKRIAEAEKAAKAEADANTKALNEIAEINDRIYLNSLSETERELELARRKYEQELALFNKYGQDVSDLTLEYEAERTRIIEAEADKQSTARLNAQFKAIEEAGRDEATAIKDRTKPADSTDAVENIRLQIRANNELIDSITAVHDAKIAAIDAELASEEISAEREAELLEMRTAADNAYYANRQNLVNTIAQLEERRQKEQVKRQLQQAQMVLSSVGNMFGSLADLYDENSEEYRNMQIAQTVVSTLAGVAQAIATAWDLGPILGAIVGTANATATLAAGIASITKMKSGSTDLSGEGGSIASTPVTGQVLDTATLSSQLGSETALDLQAQQQDVRVYVVESDITNAQNDVRTKVQQSQF